MTSEDYFQLSTAISRLQGVADFLATITNPVAMAAEIIDMISTLASILREVPGDADAIDGYAAAFRAMKTALDTADTDLDAVGAAVPSVWQGQAATEAVAALKATQSLFEQASPAMRRSADLLEDYADELRRLKTKLAGHREDLAEVVRELDSVFDVARNIWDTVNPFDNDGGLLQEVRKAIGAIGGAIDVFESLRTAQDTLRRGLRDVQGKARAGALRSSHISAFDAVTMANAGIGGTAREENGILTTAQMARAASNMDALSEADRARMQQLLDAAGSDAERAYLLKALASNHPIGEIETFAGAIHGKSEAWLRQHLSLVSPGDTGYVTFNGESIDQYNGTTCGSTSIMIARAMNDPLYAMGLTTDGNGNGLTGAEFEARIRAEEERIHNSTDPSWRHGIGTMPWGMNDEMNAHAGAFGTEYDWRWVDDTSAGSVNGALDDAVGAVDAGYTVPVLIGGEVPRHYVLLVGHEGSDLVFYEPTAGKMVRVSESDFRDGNMSALGFEHVQGVVTPK